MVFDASFNNNCSSSVSSTVGVLGVVYCVVGNFNVAFGGKVGFRNQQDVRLLVSDVGFDFFDVKGQPTGIL
jgi:hypothetical protein